MPTNEEPLPRTEGSGADPAAQSDPPPPLTSPPPSDVLAQDGIQRLTLPLLAQSELYESLVDGGDVGSKEELAKKHKLIRTVRGLGLDVDRKYFANTFTQSHYLEFAKLLIPSLEARQTSPTGNMHLVLRFKSVVEVSALDTRKKVKRLHRALKRALLADPSQPTLTLFPRVPGSKTKYDGFLVRALFSGDRVGFVELGRAFTRRSLRRTLLEALLKTLPAKNGLPCWDGQSSNCVCPIHGSGRNCEQAAISEEGVTCYADCKAANNDHPQRWTLPDILRRRVLNETDDARRILSEIERSLGFVAPPTASGKPVIRLTDGESEIGSFCVPTFEILKPTERFFDERQAQTIAEVRTRTGAQHGIYIKRHTAETLRAALPNYVQFVVCTERDGDRFKILRNDQCALLLDHRERSTLPPLDGIVRTPFYDENLELLKPGYNRDVALIYEGPRIQPATEFTAFLDLLADFPMKQDGSRANVLGLVLSTLLYSITGKNPLLVVGANQPGSGKTTLAKLIGVLVDGKVPSTITYTQDDEALEKALGAKLRLDGRTILIDNAKVSSGSKAIGSAVLERFITDDFLTTRLLGQSAEIMRKNDCVWMMTLNSPRLSPDLAQRALTVNLDLEGDPDKRKFKIPDLIPHVLDHRLEYLAEFVGLIERWKLAGAPKSTALEFSRFPTWAAVVGGVLEVNKITGFLENHRQTVAEQDSELQDLLELATSNPDDWCSASDWVSKAKPLGILRSICEKPTPRSRDTSMGQLLRRARGRRLGDEDAEVYYLVEHQKDRKGVEYCFRQFQKPPT